jgi:arginine N-succinyltransferase
MFIIRPIHSNDLEALLDLLKDSGHGLTSLPRDKDVLAQKIKHSQRSFEHRMDRPGGELYLFVMEEIFHGRIVGVSGIISKIGGFEPYYFYRLKEELFKSKMLSAEKNVKSLHFEAIYNGPAEICSLYLHPLYRNAQNGRFLSLSRFLFMSNDRKYFEDEVIAEMRGKVDEFGISPFYNAVGKKFLQMDFAQADYLTLKSKKFIDELLPKYPILIDLLPQEAQSVIAEVHDNTIPARKILEQEGFSFSGLVGIFEPGPVLKANLDEVRALKESRVAKISHIDSNKMDNNVQIICSTTGTFKATLGKIKINEDQTVNIEAVTAAGLGLKLGDAIRFVNFKP